MRRGDIITAVAPGAYGKPRPAVVVQSDRLDGIDSIVVAPCTSTLRDASAFRLTVQAGPQTGLQKRSQVMVEKLVALPVEKCGPTIGRLPPDAVANLDRMLAFVLGLAD